MLLTIMKLKVNLKFINLLKQENNVLFRRDVRGFAENEGGLYIETSPNEIDIVEDAICTFIRRIIDLRSRN